MKTFNDLQIGDVIPYMNDVWFVEHIEVLNQDKIDEKRCLLSINIFRIKKFGKDVITIFRAGFDPI